MLSSLAHAQPSACCYGGPSRHLTRRGYRIGLVLLVACFALPGPTSASTGGQLFAREGCASCHTLIAAGAAGTTGPDLSYLNPNIAIIRAKGL
jgi:hypothetical protein